MVNRVLNFIKKNRLLYEDDSVLLAISGGIDSMVMLDVMHKTHFDISVAHINHNLRDQESDGDEDFVQQVCEKHGIRYHIKHIQLDSLSNLQENARHKRYEALKAIAHAFDYSTIATGHHQDDKIETFFMNLARGSGLRGLSSIPSKNGLIIRPFLCLSKEDIMEYAQQNHVAYRDDSSNKKLTYTRNNIRQTILPKISHIDKRFDHGMKKSMENLTDENDLLDTLIQREALKIIQSNGDEFRIDKSDLEIEKGINSFLFHILNSYGFGRVQCADISDKLNLNAKDFYSVDYHLRIERDHIYWTKLNRSNPLKVQIKNIGTFVLSKDRTLTIKETNSTVMGDKNSVFVDRDMITFPWTLSKWQDGGHFQPLGMDGKSKKISKYLRDQKLSLAQKNKVQIIKNADGRIIWIIGMRLDERFKITQTTKNKLHLKVD